MDTGHGYNGRQLHLTPLGGLSRRMLLLVFIQSH